MTCLNGLDKQIEALDQIDRQDGDIAAVSDALCIPESDLSDWLSDEDKLRREHGLRRQRNRSTGWRLTCNMTCSYAPRIF